MTVVGCSGSAPGPDSAASSYLVEKDGHRLLLDLGAGAAGPLQRYSTAEAIDAVILSHAHSDHWSDVTQLSYYRSNAIRDGSDCGPLRVFGPSNMNSVLTTNPDDFATTVTRAGDLELGPMRVRLAQVRHGELECWASRVDDVLCYTADTEPCAAIEALADGCGVLLAEASGFDADGPMRGHLTAGDAGRLATKAGAKLLILTHLRAWQDHLRLLDEAAQIAACPVILAHPGLRVAL
ncbi:MBL fold metallo-hydrolase [Kribbella kalugense]|uniref:Ribonuclease BN (tRNA processing enzyme) n=1 Tax=Kribbella kalugense TaxID=2512221 RepID=A0A4R7ZWC2_9ACTN|nr:MBL fold metallo-hydrolase [Kribbella kalugense]TDW22035.1 ribonuclease BN (tRNA processing enzyme) [Kribbella kalugense]